MGYFLESVPVAVMGTATGTMELFGDDKPILAAHGAEYEKNNTSLQIDK